MPKLCPTLLAAPNMNTCTTQPQWQISKFEQDEVSFGKIGQISTNKDLCLYRQCPQYGSFRIEKWIQFQSFWTETSWGWIFLSYFFQNAASRCFWWADLKFKKKNTMLVSTVSSLQICMKFTQCGSRKMILFKGECQGNKHGDNFFVPFVMSHKNL